MRITPDTRVDDSPTVQVRLVLRPSTYRAFDARAKDLGVEVGTLLSRLAERAVTPPKSKPAREPRSRRRRTAEEWAALDERVRALNAAGLTDGKIARRLDVAQPTISTRRRGMGLVSPSPRVPRRA